MSKQPPAAPTVSAVSPCPTLTKISRTPRHWKFTQHHRTTRPSPPYIFGASSFEIESFFRVDNLAVVHIVISMTSKSENVMAVLRAFTIKCLHLNILVKARHSSSSNSVPDALSRFQLQKFRQLVPDAEPLPTPVPDHLWNIFS